jgi:hypothetical protein
MRDVKEIYFAHSLDIAWIIALYRAVHGGDPPPPLGETELERDNTTELIARGLVGHLAGPNAGAPANMIENLMKLGMKVHVKSEEQRTEIKSTKEFKALTLNHRGLPLIICIMLADGSEFCWAARFPPPFLIKV